MEHITGISRSQLRFTTLEDIISKSNTVRFIATKVEWLARIKKEYNLVAGFATLQNFQPLIL